MVLFIFNWTSDYVRKLKILGERGSGSYDSVARETGRQASKSGEGAFETG